MNLAPIFAEALYSETTLNLLIENVLPILLFGITVWSLESIPAFLYKKLTNLNK